MRREDEIRKALEAAFAPRRLEIVNESTATPTMAAMTGAARAISG